VVADAISATPKALMLPENFWRSFEFGFDEMRKGSARHIGLAPCAYGRSQGRGYQGDPAAAESGFHLLLHGDVHEERDERVGYRDAQREVYVVGGGSFGASAKDRPESTPRLYSVLEVARDLTAVRVVRRHQRTPEGPYDEYAIYRSDRGGKTGDYTIQINEPS